MWILEKMMCLSTELQRGTFHCFMVGKETDSHVFLCSTGGHSLALVPSWTAAPLRCFWRAGDGNSFTLGYNREAELLCGSSATTLEHISCALGMTNWWGPVGSVSVTPWKGWCLWFHYSLYLYHPPTVMSCLFKSQPFRVRAVSTMNSTWRNGV